jgi:murein DD-endopeptidase MepM/ murein hydrolase activator NlpD
MNSGSRPKHLAPIIRTRKARHHKLLWTDPKNPIGDKTMKVSAYSFAHSVYLKAIAQHSAKFRIWRLPSLTEFACFLIPKPITPRKFWRMCKLITIVLLVMLTLAEPTQAQNQTQVPGLYFFITDNFKGGEQTYSATSESYGNIRMEKGMNLLANILGDDPESLLLANHVLAPRINVNYVGGSSVEIQPFAATPTGSLRKSNLPIGQNLLRFLNDPLSGANFDLSLPFTDQHVALSDQSAALRSDQTSNQFHYAIDFDRSDGTTKSFNIVAPADGTIEGNRILTGGSSMAIRHRASNGKEFLTYYQHLLGYSNSLAVGNRVRRGQTIGRVEERDPDNNPVYTHLHFGIAVRGPAGTVNGQNVPEMWYEIDPFGVYDYRINRYNMTTYNYLPNNTLDKPVQGRVAPHVFKTNPPLGSLPTPWPPSQTNNSAQGERCPISCPQGSSCVKVQEQTEQINDPGFCELKPWACKPKIVDVWRCREQ